MFRFRDYSITKKLTWMNMVVSGAALLLACAAFLAYELVTFRETMVRSLSIQAQIIGSNSVSAVLFNDPHSAENTLAALKAAPNIVSAWIYTQDGRPFAGYSRDRGGQTLPLPAIPAGQTEVHSFGDGYIVLIRSIVFQGKPTGTVYIRSDLREMNASLKRYAGIVGLVLSTSLIAALLISSRSRRAVAEPIVRLAETARIVSREKDYSARVPTTGNDDEVATLIGAFNEMLSQIQERDTALQKAHGELEQRVQERTAELEAANKELEAFTYSVSHDLRAPLRHIDGFSKLLAEEHNAELSKEAAEYVALIRDSTREMGQLVDDLLNLARVGRKELSLQVTGLDSLVEEVVGELGRESAGRTIEWKLQQLPFVECDPGLMKQVFTNLLSNAIKYTRPREQAIIELGVIKQNGNPVVFVRDNGVGFNMKNAGKLFGVFQRLHRQEDFEGTGVGLATIQRIIHKHGGHVWAEAELDRGATFYFTLKTLGDEGLVNKSTSEVSDESKWCANLAGGG